MPYMDNSLPTLQRGDDTGMDSVSGSSMTAGLHEYRECRMGGSGPALQIPLNHNFQLHGLFPNVVPVVVSVPSLVSGG